MNDVLAESDSNSENRTSRPILAPGIGQFPERLREVIGNTSLRRFSKRCGMSDATLREYLRGSTTPTLERLAVIAREGNVSVEWLAAGVAHDLSKCSPGFQDRIKDDFEKYSRPPGASVIMEGLPASEFYRREDDGYAYIPLYEVRAAAGHGTFVEQERAVDSLAFRQAWVRNELRADPSDLYLIKVDGESMEPVLRSGDVILVNHQDNSAQRDGIYVMRIDDALLVKRLQPLPDGRLRASSDNPAYEPFDIERERMGDNAVSIIGRVVWTGRRL